MALSFAQYLGDGVTRLFPVPFEYLNKAHVSVTVNGDPAVPVWEGNQAVRLSSAPATDAVVEVARNTPGDTRLVDFVDGSVLTERDLDLSALQLLFIAQEASDRASRSLGLTPSGKFDARGLEIINAGSPSAPTSVATRQWTEDAIEGAIEPVASKTTFFFVEKSPEASAVSKDQMDAADRATLEASNGYADEKLGTVAAELAKKLNKSEIASGICRNDVPDKVILGDSFRAVGTATAGDAGQGALYIRGTQYGPMPVRDAAGVWWELCLPDGAMHVDWFGAVGNGVADDTDAFVRALAFAKEKTVMILGARSYVLSATLSWFDKQINWCGPGRDQCTMTWKAGVDCGIDANLGKDRTFTLQGISLLTRSVDFGTALKVQFHADSTNIFGHRDDRRVFLQDFRISGENFNKGGWSRCGHFTNINGCTIKAGWLVGRSDVNPDGSAVNTEASYQHTLTGFEWDGDIYPTDWIISDFRAYNIVNPIKIRGLAEGINFDQLTFVNVGIGIDWVAGPNWDGVVGARPQCTVTNSHFNVFQTAIKLGFVSQINLNGNEIYHHPSALSAGVLLDMNTIEDGNIFANKFSKYSSSFCSGLRIFGALTKNIQICNNTFGTAYGPLDQALVIDNGMVGVHIYPNNFFNTPLGVQCADTNSVRFGAARCRLSQGVGQTVPSEVPTVLNWDTVIENTAKFTVSADGAVTVPGAGVMRISVSAGTIFENNPNAGRQLIVKKNGALLPFGGIVTGRGDNGGYSCALSLSSGVFAVAPGDVITIECNQNSGGPLTLNGAGLTWVSIEVHG